MNSNLSKFKAYKLSNESLKKITGGDGGSADCLDGTSVSCPFTYGTSCSAVDQSWTDQTQTGTINCTDDNSGRVVCSAKCKVIYA